MISTIGTQPPKLEWLKKEPTEVPRSIHAIIASKTSGYAVVSSAAIFSEVFVRTDLEDVFVCS